MNYQLDKKLKREKTSLIDSGRRLRLLDFTKAPWPDIRKELKEVGWSPNSRLAVSGDRFEWVRYTVGGPYLCPNFPVSLSSPVY